MKTLIALLTFAFAVNASATSLHPDTFKPVQVSKFSCITEEGNMLQVNLEYGEITEMDKEGNFLLDYDDGYDHQYLVLESFPPIDSYSVWHHEETDIIVFSVSRRAGDWGPFKGTYLNTNNKKVSVNCLN